MCELLSCKRADKDFEDLIRSGFKEGEERLIELAGESTRTSKAGLEHQLRGLSSFKDDLRTVRKCRVGRHRVYVEGRNTDCRYIVRTIVINKKGDVDKPEDIEFQNKLRRILEQPTTRRLRLPD